MVYEQSDSLKPAADKLEARDRRRPTTCTRTPAPGATGPLANAKFLEALFAQRLDRRTSATPKAIDIGAEPARCRRASSSTRRRTCCRSPRCKDRVRQQLAASQAAALARKKLGGERLAQARAAPRSALPATSGHGLARPATRPAAAGARRRAEGAGGDKLPAFVGVDARRPGLRGRAASSRLLAAIRSPPIRRRRWSSTRRSGRDAEARGLLRRAEDALQGRGSTSRPWLRAKARRAARAPSAWRLRAASPSRVARYNLPLGGGCSSVGRVQDCDSCCRGFEPHQPPQTNRTQIRRLECPIWFLGARTAPRSPP